MRRSGKSSPRRAERRDAFPPVRRGAVDPAEPSALALSPGTAREAAFHTLESVRRKALRVAEAWSDVVRTASLSPLDHNLSRELAFGVIRREITLDLLLQRLVRRPLAEIEPPLKTVLHLGLYQLLFAEQIPLHAAVHETVELAKEVGRLRWAGFVNGVLRQAARLATDQFSEEPSTKALPLGGMRFRLLAENVFPDPEEDEIGYFWQAYGYPEWLARRWAKRWSLATLHRLGQWQRMPPPLFVRVNRLRTTRDELLMRFGSEGIQAETASLPEALRVVSGGRIERWPGFEEGLFSIQDLSAMTAARRLAPTPGSRVLDLCAAPGGKTCHLAELMDDSGEILAVDVRPTRLARIVENVRRLGLTSVQALLASEEGHDLPAGPFDYVLVDVPCSNTGVIGRRPEIVRHLNSSALNELRLRQGELLRRAAERLRGGGRLLYSTCSIESEENENIVHEFLRQHPEFRLIEANLMLPGDPADGGYQALLERSQT